MKKLFNPGFEFLFALGLIAIFVTPAIVMAQKHTESFEVNINNKDTVINGKNIKDLTPAERKEALAKLDHMGDGTFMFKTGDGDQSKHVTIHMRKNDNNTNDVIIEHNGQPGEVIATIPDRENHFFYKTDSAGHGGRVELRTMSGNNDMNLNFEPRVRANGDMPQVFSFNNGVRGGSAMTMTRGRKNSQSFSYSSTDADGISTHLNFNVSDASGENAKRIAGTEKADLELKDLSLTPQFSTGKTTISFGLGAPGAAEVSLKNTEGKILWTDKTTTGSFSKSFELPQNGVYYLQVKQGTKLGLKRITKEG